LSDISNLFSFREVWNQVSRTFKTIIYYVYVQGLSKRKL